MEKWKAYRKSGTTEMRPYIQGEDLNGISVSAADNPEATGGMVARNPNNHADQWFVARDYFNANYIEA